MRGGSTSSPWRNSGCIRVAIHRVWLRCSSLTYALICSFVAPCQPGASPLSVQRRVPPRAACLQHIAAVQFHRRLASRSRRRRVIGAYHPEPDQPVAFLRQGGRPVGRPEIVGLGRVTAAARDPEVAFRGADRVARVALEVRAVPVQAPLLDVAVHVVQTPWVGGGAADVQRDDVVAGAARRVGEPGAALVLCHPRRRPISAPERCRGAGPARVLPLRLGGQTEFGALALRQPAAVGGGVMPAHEHHRFVVIRREPQLAAQFPVPRVEHLILCVGDLALGNGERSGDGNAVHGHLVEIAVAEAGGRQQRVGQRPVVPHQERTGINPPQPYTGRSGQAIPPRSCAAGSAKYDRTGAARQHPT